MAKMYKCTRCGNVFGDRDFLDGSYAFGSKLRYGDLDVKNKNMYESHLCPACSHDLQRWLEFGGRYKIVKTKKFKKELKKRKKGVRKAVSNPISPRS